MVQVMVPKGNLSDKLRQPFKGVGVLRHPPGEDNKKLAEEMVANLKTGDVLVLPNSKDSETGEYVWDFHIEVTG